MISSPLFSMVAESMVMRRPITQVGCLSACSGVMAANCSSGSLPERSARGRQPDGLHLSVRAHPQALVHGVVLAVDGQDGHIALARCAGKNFARRHHALLVGQAHGLARQNGRVRRLQARPRPQWLKPQNPHPAAWSRPPCLPFREPLQRPLRRPAFSRAGKLAGQLFRGQRNQPADASGRPAQTLRPRCARQPARPPGSGRETAQRWRGCFGRWSRWNREWRVASKCLQVR